MNNWAISALVIGLVSLPIIGIGLAFYTGNMAWLLMLFALALFA